MREERRAILSLIAAGRISASEAERLMAAWSADREALWLVVAGLALVVAQGVFHGPAIGHLAHALAPAVNWVAQHTIAMIGKGFGGMQ